MVACALGRGYSMCPANWVRKWPYLCLKPEPEDPEGQLQAVIIIIISEDWDCLISTCPGPTPRIFVKVLKF